MTAAITQSLSEVWKKAGAFHDRLEGWSRRLREGMAALPGRKLLGPGSPLGGILLLLPVVAILWSLGSGLPWGVELAGGTEFELTLTQQADEARIHKTVNDFFNDTCEVQRLSDTLNYVVRTRRSPAREAEADELLRTLQAALDQEVKLVHARSFGSWRAPENYFQFLISTGVALGAMFLLFLLWYKEHPLVAVQALLALSCDVSAIVIAVHVMQIPISLPILAAIVTLIGYSVNDSIVIAHKIRDHVRYHGRAPLFVVARTEEESDPARLTRANLRAALGSVMSRIVITSVSTICPLVGLLFVGRGVLRNYAIVMLAGLTVGLLSSYFIVGCWSLGFGEKRKYA